MNIEPIKLVRNGRYVLLSAFLLLTACSGKEALFVEDSGDWDAYGAADWTFEGDELTGKVSGGKTGFVMTQGMYDNFELVLEFRPDATINSGVFIRCAKTAINTDDCYELNIWDSNPNQDYRTGAMVNKTKAMEVVATINRWNNYKIRAENDHIQVWINGTIITDARDQSQTRGFIGLQALGNGTIKFRNIHISPL